MKNEAYEHAQRKAMPRYRCDKEVHALEIRAANRLDSGDIVLEFEDRGFADLKIPAHADLVQRIKATKTDPGYFVVYADGYRSWSPTLAFEAGYTKIS